MNTIQEHRQKAVLDKLLNYEGEGVLSRRQWLARKRAEGFVAFSEDRRNYAAEEKLTQWLYDNRGDMSGNPNWPPTKRYMEKRAELKVGVFKTVYQLRKDNSIWDITKIEYDFYNSNH